MSAEGVRYDALTAKLRATTDAQVWADEFCKRFSLVAVGIEPAVLIGDDLGVMLGWFANAIEIGRDAGRREQAEARNDGSTP